MSYLSILMYGLGVFIVILIQVIIIKTTMHFNPPPELIPTEFPDSIYYVNEYFESIERENNDK